MHHHRQASGSPGGDCKGVLKSHPPPSCSHSFLSSSSGCGTHLPTSGQPRPGWHSNLIRRRDLGRGCSVLELLVGTRDETVECGLEVAEAASWFSAGGGGDTRSRNWRQYGTVLRG